MPDLNVESGDIRSFQPKLINGDNSSDVGSKLITGDTKTDKKEELAKSDPVIKSVAPTKSTDSPADGNKNAGKKRVSSKNAIEEGQPEKRLKQEN